jgi:myo-inositol-1(or 4)-monophosphatase
VFATGIPFGGSPHLPAALREMAALTPRTAGIRRWGSAALDLAYVAAGRFDGFWEHALNPWDIAGGILLVREAGGFVGPLAAEGDMMARAGILAANAQVFETVSGILRQA